ncbi:MAG: hypothetical protein M1835_006965 [Candelina submexicana]|nr:MAG: hypothetical protein M1835_006965 [Candelina submexicana]
MPPSPPPSLHTLLPTLTTSLKSFTTSSSKFRILHRIPPSPPPPPSPAQPSTLYIFDSSFNPPTLAHFQIATSALLSQPNKRAEDEDKGSAERLLLLLATRNADKAAQPASFEQRLGLMVGFGEEVRMWLCGEGREDVRVDVGVTTEPFYHAKAAAVAESGVYSSSDDDNKEGEEGKSGGKFRAPLEQVYLLGYDSLIRLFDQKYYEQGKMGEALAPFFEKCRVRVTLRENDEWGGREEQENLVDAIGKGEQGAERGWRERIECVEGMKEAVSSTRAREAAKKGDEEEVGRLCTRSVADRVLRERLYQD